jgi:hypothetical protein
LGQKPPKSIANCIELMNSTQRHAKRKLAEETATTTLELTAVHATVQRLEQKLDWALSALAYRSTMPQAALAPRYGVPTKDLFSVVPGGPVPDAPKGLWRRYGCNLECYAVDEAYANFSADPDRAQKSVNCMFCSVLYSGFDSNTTMNAAVQHLVNYQICVPRRILGQNEIQALRKIRECQALVLHKDDLPPPTETYGQWCCVLREQYVVHTSQVAQWKWVQKSPYLFYEHPMEYLLSRAYEYIWLPEPPATAAQTEASAQWRENIMQRQLHELGKGYDAARCIWTSTFATLLQRDSEGQLATRTWLKKRLLARVLEREAATTIAARIARWVIKSAPCRHSLLPSSASARAGTCSLAAGSS